MDQTLKGKVMAKQMKRFTEEFRIEAVKLCDSSDKPIEIIAKELGVGLSTLHMWRNKYNTSPLRRNAANRKTITSNEIELIKMKRENERLKKENEILKKAAAYFAKANM